MSMPETQAFIDALGRLEAERDVERLVALYAPNGQTGNVQTKETFSGPDGARVFWTQYRASFGDLTSTFRTVIEAGRTAALEWTSSGTSPDGQPIRYEGVSIIEFGDAGIHRFRAYFDPLALGDQLDRR